jgi:uncharacterized protein
MTSERVSDVSSTTACWCCGEERGEPELARLEHHSEVALCDVCLEWLRDTQALRRGNRLQRAIPILATADVARALEHYAALGFETEAWGGGGYGFASRDGVELHLSEVDGHDPAANLGSCYLFVGDADALHAEWVAAHARGELQAPSDADHGLREGRHVDPDGNVIRYGSPLRGSDRTPGDSMLLAADDPIAVAATTAVQAGDLDTLTSLLAVNPGLATARIGDHTMSRTLLHAATDWPGHFPRVGHAIEALVRAGADVNARFVGAHAETPLHWAASSDDIEALNALIDAGADLEASGAVLGGGSPLADAVGFGQWQVARRLVERGATTRLKDAAALGLLDRVEASFAADPPPTPELVTDALWAACHAGQRSTAEYLLERGADVNWIGWDDLTPLDVAVQADATDLAAWLRTRGAKRARELR